VRAGICPGGTAPEVGTQAGYAARMHAHDRLADWLGLLDRHFPERDAQSWDATGLQVGDPDDPVRAVLVCLDVTEATIDEALARGADLLLAHHPLLFRPLARLTPDTAPGRLALRAARARLAVVAVHTNFDAAVDGTSTPVLNVLGVAESEPLVPLDPPPQAKLVTFVPPGNTTGVLEAMAAAGAGIIGEYEQCSYRVTGTGTFRPSAAANPHTGERERLNEVTEERLEIVVPAERVGNVVAALVAAHPYEEVAYDLYPMLADTAGSKGLGRVGDLPAALPLREVADRLATALPAPHLRIAGDLERPVRRVAACGGAGDALIGAARRSGADVYVTGDLRHHVTLDALTQGLAVIDAGHHATEAAALPALRAALGAAATARGLRARLLASEVSTDPWVPHQAPDGAGFRQARGGGEGPTA
jgi:dinuclear metal center YbgI/SA1388 family protein